MALRARFAVAGPRSALVAALLVGTSACVSKGTHNSTLADLSSARAGQDTLRDEIASLEEHIDSLVAVHDIELTRRDQMESALQQTIADLEREQRSLEQDLAAARADSERLETMAGLRGAELQSQRRRLESLRAVEEEIRQRNAIYEDVIARFQSLVDGGQLSVTIDRGRMVIQLPQDILFQSGSATLGAEGRSVISQVGSVLADFDDRRFQVEGHTDDVPISTERFPSNWELSSARALAVVRLLTAQGVAPENVSGAAFGEHQPRASNDDRASRALNRRIEIVMLPNLDVIATTQVPG
mgnify:CR=1 FL=1